MRTQPHVKNTVKVMKLADLKASPYNPRKISPEALKGLTASIRQFGLTQPIVWNKRSGWTVSGHQRVKALKALGETEAVVMVVDWDDTKEKAANLAHNNKAIEGEFTDEADALLEELKAADETMYAELLLEEIEAPEPTDETPPGIDGGVEVSAKTPKNTGEMWKLGEHHLMCGDSTKADAVYKLMAGSVKPKKGAVFSINRAALLFTDPPYGVDYASKSGKFELIKGDEKKGDDLANKLLLPALTNAIQYTREDAAFYVWHASSTRDDFSHAMKKAGLVERAYLIWAKPSAALGWGDYQWAHEPCFYASKDGKEPAFYGDRKQSTVWRVTHKDKAKQSTVVGPGVLIQDGEGDSLVITREAKGRKFRSIRVDEGDTVVLSTGDNSDVWEVGKDGKTDHPTQKPVALAHRAIMNSSEEGQVVLDLFLGSGATLMAAEITGRVCYGMEYDRGYCDAVIRRWEKLTGRKAEKLS